METNQEKTNNIDEAKSFIIQTSGNVKKTLQEKTFDILKWLAVFVIIGWLGSNLFIKYSEGRIEKYNTKIEHNQEKLDSINTEISLSIEEQIALDIRIKESKQKSLYYEKKVSTLINEFKRIRENVKDGTTNDAYNVVSEYLDSLRTKNIKQKTKQND